MILRNSIVSWKWDDFKALEEVSKLRFAESIVTMEEGTPFSQLVPIILDKLKVTDSQYYWLA
jgi:hypothetical protein